MTGSSLASSRSCFRNLSRLPWHSTPRFPEFQPKAFPAKPLKLGVWDFSFNPGRSSEIGMEHFFFSGHHIMLSFGMEGYDLLHGYAESSQKSNFFRWWIHLFQCWTGPSARCIMASQIDQVPWRVVRWMNLPKMRCKRVICTEDTCFTFVDVERNETRWAMQFGG